MTAARWHDKADSFVHGWRERLGDDPPLHAVVLGLSVAQHETACGDAWPGEHNWGAVQKRTPNQHERVVLSRAGIAPSPKNVAAARVAIQAAIDSGESLVIKVPELDAKGKPTGKTVDKDIGPCPTLTDEALHCDSSPGKGWYFVYFWAFKTDVGGASLFVKILAVNRPGCRAVLLNENGTELQLAEGMYNTGYYEGFYKGGSWYTKGADGKWHEWVSSDPHPPGAMQGSSLNIKAYAGSLSALTPGIRQALRDWQPPSGEPTEDPAPETDPSPNAPTEPAPPLIQLEVDWDEIRRARDDLIREWED